MATTMRRALVRSYGPTTCVTLTRVRVAGGLELSRGPHSMTDSSSQAFGTHARCVRLRSLCEQKERLVGRAVRAGQPHACPWAWRGPSGRIACGSVVPLGFRLRVRGPWWRVVLSNAILPWYAAGGRRLVVIAGRHVTRHTTRGASFPELIDQHFNNTRKIHRRGIMTLLNLFFTS